MIKDLYVSKSVTMDEINKTFGQIKEENIEYFEPKN